MTISVVLADANILFSRTLRDYFRYLADAGAIEIHWSQRILDEMSPNLRKRIGLSRVDTDRLEALMNAYIEYALIDVEAEDLATVADVAMDTKDRHVLAAAVSAEADILLTDNTARFPADWMATHGIAPGGPPADRSPVPQVRSRHPRNPGIDRRRAGCRHHPRARRRSRVTVRPEPVGGVL